MAHRLTTVVSSGLLLGAMSGLMLMGMPAAAADTDSGAATSVSSAAAKKTSVDSGDRTSKSPDRKWKSAKQRSSAGKKAPTVTAGRKPTSTPADGPQTKSRAGKRAESAPEGPPMPEDGSAPAPEPGPSVSEPFSGASPSAESPGKPDNTQMTVALPVGPAKTNAHRDAVEPETVRRAESDTEPPAVMLSDPRKATETATATKESSEETPDVTAPGTRAAAASAIAEPTRTAVTENATVTLAAAATTTGSTRAPSIINVVGSVVMNLLVGLIHLIDGPPVLPPGSTVTVRTSSLTLPIGTGQKVQADWYFPEDVDESTRLVYLQHGFLASGPMYSYTAANLAERTNSIVVAPSLSSNFFDPTAAWVGGSTMQRAVADLFVGDREALTASAAGAGYTGALPQTFVLVGHSAGGTLVTAVAGYLADMNATEDLAGVVMLDGVEPKGSNAVSDALDKLTDEHFVPVYLISSQRYMWSRDGDMADKLMAARPTEFNGVGLTEGMHIDYMEGGNTLLQAAEYVIAGFSHRENIDAAGLITAGWVNDLFAGTTTDGIYGDPLQSIAVLTAGGVATAVVLPLGPTGTSPLGPILDPLLAAIFEFAGSNWFVYEPLAGSTVSV